MGLPKGIVRKVFSKCTCSSSIEEGSERKYGVDKSRWSAARFHLCGDDFDSIVVEDNLTSHIHSEVTAAQSVAEPPSVEEDEETHPLINPQKTEEENDKEEEEEEEEEPLSQEDAAILIQSAFRRFLARKLYRELHGSDEGCEFSNLGNSSAILETMSTEVQLGDSVYSFSVDEESFTVIHHAQRKARSQVFRPKEEWDDSTVSSNILKMRTQNKLEASTRREKALAYAFSQQLRTCTTKRRSDKSDATESSVGWSWLERWMAARQDHHIGKKYEANNSGIQRPTTTIRHRFDMAIEEKESCGSNDVSVNLDRGSSPSRTPKVSLTQSAGRSRMKVMTSAPSRKQVPDYRCARPSNKVSKRTTEGEPEKGKRCKEGGEPKSINEMKARDASEAPSDY